MLNLYRGALALIGLSALYAGALNSILASDVVEKFYGVQFLDTQVSTAIDVQVRILAGMWTAIGLFVLYSLPRFSRHIVALYFVFLGFALSSIGEFASAAILGNALDALLKMLAQVGVCLGMSVWGHFAAKRQARTT
jgi:hypothetical protein